MKTTHQFIQIHPLAPPKPPEGQPCNGCGVCCLMEPCPLGMLLSHRRHGACDAVRWDGAVYRCGAMAEPESVLQQALPRWLRPWSGALAPRLKSMATRMIAPGIGCDCDSEVESS